MKRTLVLVILLGFLSVTTGAQTPVYPADRILATLNAVVASCPRAWQHAHHPGDPERYDFIIHAAKRLYTESNGTVSANWRRGVHGDLSMDGLTFRATNDRFYFADVIGGAGGPSPSLTFNITGEAPSYGFVAPADLPAAVVACSADPGSECPVCPPVPPKPPYPGDQYWVAFGNQLATDYAEAGRPLDGSSGIWFARVTWDHAINGLPLAEAVKKQREGPDGWRRALGLQ